MIEVTFEWVILGLRFALIGLLFFFLAQVARATMRELGEIAAARAPRPAAADPGRASGVLVVIDPAESTLMPGESFSLNPITLVGRRAGCGIPIDDAYVSSEHAELSFRDGNWVVRDLESTNGTFVDGEKVDRTRIIGSGNIVQFGRVTMRFEA